MRSSKELIHDITKSKVHDKKWWFDLKQEVADFFKSDAPKSEKDEVAQYSEMLLMVCKGLGGNYNDEDELS